MKPTFLAIGAGAVSGLLVVASLSKASIAVPFLMLVLPMPLLMVGLGQGTRAALIAVMSGALLSMTASPGAGLMFVILFGAPVWILVRLALTGPQGPIAQAPEHPGPFHQEGPDTRSTFQDRILGRTDNWTEEAGAAPRDLGWFPAGHILAVMAVIACALIVGAALVTGGLQDAVMVHLTKLAEAMTELQGQEIPPEAITKASSLFAGVMAASWVVMLLSNAALAQGLLAKGGRNLRPTPRLRELSLPDWLSWALVAAALIAVAATGEMGYIARNLFLVLAVPFFFLGLAVVHKLAGLTSLPGALLALFYLALIYSGFLMGLLFVAGLGILEQWVGLKRRMNKPT